VVRGGLQLCFGESYGCGSERIEVVVLGDLR
jgi:hypothetical protein